MPDTVAIDAFLEPLQRALESQVTVLDRTKFVWSAVAAVETFRSVIGRAVHRRLEAWTQELRDANRELRVAGGAAR